MQRCVYTAEIIRPGYLLLHFFVEITYRAHQTIELLQRQTPAFIAADLWLPDSRDLNPVDDRILSVMEYQKPVGDVTDLRPRLTDARC